jgi:hypothetical protein
LDRNLATIFLRLRDWDGYAQNSIGEFGAHVFCISPFRESDGPIKFAVSPLRPLDSAFRFLVLELAFSLNYEEIIVDFYFDVLFREAGQVGRDNQVSISISDFSGGHPGGTETIVATPGDIEPGLREYAIHFALHPADE